MIKFSYFCPQFLSSPMLWLGRGTRLDKTLWICLRIYCAEILDKFTGTAVNDPFSSQTYISRKIGGLFVSWLFSFPGCKVNSSDISGSIGSLSVSPLQQVPCLKQLKKIKKIVTSCSFMFIFNRSKYVPANYFSAVLLCIFCYLENCSGLKRSSVCISWSEVISWDKRPFWIVWTKVSAVDLFNGLTDSFDVEVWDNLISWNLFDPFVWTLFPRLYCKCFCSKISWFGWIFSRWPGV